MQQHPVSPLPANKARGIHKDHITQHGHADDANRNRFRLLGLNIPKSLSAPSRAIEIETGAISQVRELSSHQGPQVRILRAGLGTLGTCLDPVL